jgi:uncharacterized protein YciI
MKMLRIKFLFIFLITSFTVSSQSFTGKYMVFLNSNPHRPEIPQAEVEALQQAHRANMDSLAKAGRMIAAGPFHGGGGIFVMVARSKDEVLEMIMTDPAITAKRFITEIFNLNMNIGGICPTGDIVDMTEYQFMRYHPVKEVIEKTKEKKRKQLEKRHIHYLKSSFYKHGLIADATFEENSGGFLVAFNPSDDEFDTFLKYDPWLKSGLYTLETRILWIAKGSFCERKKSESQ